MHRRHFGGWTGRACSGRQEGTPLSRLRAQVLGGVDHILQGRQHLHASHATSAPSQSSKQAPSSVRVECTQKNLDLPNSSAETPQEVHKERAAGAALQADEGINRTKIALDTQSFPEGYAKQCGHPQETSVQRHADTKIVMCRCASMFKELKGRMQGVAPGPTRGS